MKKTILLSVALVAGIAFAACDSKKSDSDQTEAEAAQGMSELRSDVANVAEWVGTYEGTIAQADGAGFSSTLELKGDSTFVFTQAANQGEGALETSEGAFTVEPESKVITLTATNGNVTKFLYEGTSVLMLDAEGNKPENEEMYRLMKKAN